MPKWFDRLFPTPPVPAVIQLPGTNDTVLASGMVAAAQELPLTRDRVTPTMESWQEESWDFYDELGEFRYAIDWRAEMVSRVRLKAARKVQDSDEPEIVEDGPAYELIQQLIDGSAGGESQLMRSFAVSLGVAGECWLTGETNGDTAVYRVRSADEIRQTRDTRVGRWQVIDDEKSSNSNEVWRPLASQSLVGRVWDPSPRKFYKPDSPARAARQTLRELELVNRHIQAGYLSRLASAGLLKVPAELDFPVRPEFANDPNPLMRELVEVARTAIRTPGTAAATIPIPLVGAAEYLKELQFLDVTVKADEKILEKRDSAIRRLATQLDLPAEVLLGMGDVNHWSAWQIEESGVKVHILPMVEKICEALVKIYLAPRLKASGLDPAEWTVWYDASEITIRPDRSAAAELAYANFTLSEASYLREVGFDESDQPTDEELERIILKQYAKDPASVPTALKALTGAEIEPVSSKPQSEIDAQVEIAKANAEAEPEPDAPEAREEPDTKDEAPPAAQAASAMAADLADAVVQARRLQAGLKHHLALSMDGAKVLHPMDCVGLKTPCPFNTALPKYLPGKPGKYELNLVGGKLRVGPLRQDTNRAHQRA